MCVGGGGQHLFFLVVVDGVFLSRSVRCYCCHCDFERIPYFSGAVEIRNSHSLVINTGISRRVSLEDLK